MQSAFSLRQLAEHLGLSHATVSEALRDSPRVKAATRQRVAAAALELGYRRNPLASALMGEMRRSRGGVFRGSVALLEGDVGVSPATQTRHDALVRGAMWQAESMGFSVDRLRLDGRGCPPARIGEIFSARGTRGVFLLPGFTAAEAERVDWSQVTAVIAGEPWADAPFHSVCADDSAGVWQCLRHLRSMGYRRPGIVLDPALGVSRMRRERAAFCAYFHDESEDLDLGERVFSLAQADLTQFAVWMRDRGCDVALAQSASVIARLRDLDVPGATYCCLDLPVGERACAGADLRHDAVGRRAMELLIEQVLKNERGPAAVPCVTRVVPVWVPGPGPRAAARAA